MTDLVRSFIKSDQPGFFQRVTPDDLKQVLAAAIRGNVEHTVQCEQPENIVMNSRRRARPDIPDIICAVQTGDAKRRARLRYHFGLGRYIPHNPMIERPFRRVGVLQNKRERSCTLRQPTHIELRANIPSVARVSLRDIVAVLKGRAR